MSSHNNNTYIRTHKTPKLNNLAQCYVMVLGGVGALRWPLLPAAGTYLAGVAATCGRQRTQRRAACEREGTEGSQGRAREPKERGGRARAGSPLRGGRGLSPPPRGDSRASEPRRGARLPVPGATARGASTAPRPDFTGAAGRPHRAPRRRPLAPSSARADRARALHRSVGRRPALRTRSPQRRRPRSAHRRPAHP